MISVSRILRLSAWVTPRQDENRVEGERNLAAGNWSEAEKFLTLALAEGRPSKQSRLELLLGLMEAQRKQGKAADAEKTSQMAIELAAASKNKELQSKALDGLVEIQLDQKKYGEAEATVGKIEALERKNPDFKRLASAARQMGTALLNSGRAEEAMKAFERATELSEKSFGSDHAETGNALSELGAQYRAIGNHVDAQRCLRRALEIHRKTSGADSHAATQDLFRLASSLEETGHSEAAAAEFEKMLALKERQIGGDREQTAVTQAHLAAIYMRAGRTSAARELLIHAIGVLRKKDERLEFALETMAEVEEMLNHAEEAERWRAKAAESVALRTGQMEPAAATVVKTPKYY